MLKSFACPPLQIIRKPGRISNCKCTIYSVKPKIIMLLISCCCCVCLCFLCLIQGSYLLSGIQTEKSRSFNSSLSRTRKSRIFIFVENEKVETCLNFFIWFFDVWTKLTFGMKEFYRAVKFYTVVKNNFKKNRRFGL